MAGAAEHEFFIALVIEALPVCVNSFCNAAIFASVRAKAAGPAKKKFSMQQRRNSHWHHEQLGDVCQGSPSKFQPPRARCRGPDDPNMAAAFGSRFQGSGATPWQG